MDLNQQPTDYESAALTIELRAQTVYLPRFTAFISLSTMPIVTIFLTIERPCHRFLKQPFPARGGHSLKYTVEMAGRAEVAHRFATQIYLDWQRRNTYWQTARCPSNRQQVTGPGAYT